MFLVFKYILFPVISGEKAAGVGVNHPSTSSAEVKEKV
jgi:hypothetical protein